MLRWRKKIRRMTYLVVDSMSILGAFELTYLYYVINLNRVVNLTGLEVIGLVFTSLVVYLSLFIMLNVYEDTIEDGGRIKGKTIVKMGICLGGGTILVAAGLYYMNVELSRLFNMLFLGAFVMLLVFNRILLKATQFRGKEEAQSVRNILVVGCSANGKRYIQEIKKYNYLDIKIIGYISIKNPSSYDGAKHIGNIDELDSIVHDYVIDEIAVARPLSYDERLRPLLNRYQDMGITITMLLDIQNTQKTKAHVAMVGNIPVLKLHTVSLNEGQIFMKRILDVCGSLVGMILFGIAYLIVGPLIKLETPGPVIFKQDRVGKNGRIFKVWKFRSMGVNAEAEKAALLATNEMSGHMFKMTNDPRVTKVGGFIRKTSIDELPQFFNVLRGDMSLVGTRPPTVKEVAEYEDYHHKRICITPGITGNWQVSGRSDIEDFEEVVRLDSEYIANWSVWLDIKILLKTVLVVFKRKGSK